ncbi:MAG: hypothetical protein ACI8TQ_002310 [Planctomycetota bacterium]|jgi:hypothetical protein
MASERSSGPSFILGLIVGSVACAAALYFAVGIPKTEQVELAPLKTVIAASGESDKETFRLALKAETARATELEDELAALREEFNLAERKRVDRELEFLNLSRAIADFDLDSPKMLFTKELLEQNPGEVKQVAEPVEVDAKTEALRLRSQDFAAELRALLASEWVRGLDPIELGLLNEEGWTGPVVFRLVDDRGRLTGSLSAERLRLEGSLSGRIVTMILEEGEERSGGSTMPFARGVRRFVFPGVDPGPWVEALPELFSNTDLTAKDDGLWALDEIRAKLNQLLIDDATGDVFELRHLGGVVEGVLRDLHLIVRERGGSTKRHLFADRCTIQKREKGVLILLEDGVTMRGGNRSPFLEGRYRIFLPNAKTEAWLAAGLPGLVEPVTEDSDENDDLLNEESGS